VLGVVKRHVCEQRVDRREAVVATAHAVAASVLKVLQERSDQRRVELGDVQLAGRLAGPLGSEAEQQPERLAIGGDRVRAGSALGDQPVAEVGLHRGRECAHRTPPNRSLTRSAASAISSGEADKYQYVSAGLTCPR
jgi:hypothetical protein